MAYQQVPATKRRSPDTEGNSMGQAVVHFEIIGQDGTKLQNYYSDLFGWEIDSKQPNELRNHPTRGEH